MFDRSRTRFHDKNWKKSGARFFLCFIIDIYVWNCLEGLRGDDHMVVGFSPITTKVVSSNPVLGEVY
jgi:hypothetical protein